MHDGVLDGTPLLPDDVERQRWVDVCTAHYDAVHDGDPQTLLRSYAGTNPGEFFAVTTETFFTRSIDLAARHPDLYEVFAGFYRQDPATRAAPRRAASARCRRGDGAAHHRPPPTLTRRDYAATVCLSATVRASSMMARPSRISSSLIVIGGTTWVRLKWTNGHRPRSLQAPANSAIGAFAGPEAL